MKLIQELISIIEADDAPDGEDKITPQKNLDAVDLILRSDGDIPVGGKSQNQMDSMGEQDGKKMFYVSINPPHADVEAYVVVDKSGNFSYYDFTQESVVINGELMGPRGDRVTSEWQDQMEELINEYKLESGEVAEGGIKAFLDLLKTAH